jgi:hypothetical protein
MFSYGFGLLAVSSGAIQTAKRASRDEQRSNVVAMEILIRDRHGRRDAFELRREPPAFLLAVFNSCILHSPGRQVVLGNLAVPKRFALAVCDPGPSRSTRQPGFPRVSPRPLSSYNRNRITHGKLFHFLETPCGLYRHMEYALSQFALETPIVRALLQENRTNSVAVCVVLNFERRTKTRDKDQRENQSRDHDHLIFRSHDAIPRAL